MLWANGVGSNVAGWQVSLAIILAGYLLGCATAGYYLVRWRRGSDIRSKGSGSVGATNVSREMGATGFAVTVALDMAKGALASWLAIRFHLGPVAQLLAMLAAILGHIWPVQLRFRGGKGAATLGGVVLVADYRVFLLVLGLFVVPFVFLRRFTLSGLTALALAPVVLVFGFSLPGRALGFFIILLPIFWAHKENIREDLRSIFAGAGNRLSGGNSSRKE